MYHTTHSSRSSFATSPRWDLCLHKSSCHPRQIWWKYREVNHPIASTHKYLSIWLPLAMIRIDNRTARRWTRIRLQDDLLLIILGDNCSLVSSTTSGNSYSFHLSLQGFLCKHKFWSGLAQRRLKPNKVKCLLAAVHKHIDGLVQDCSISSALAMEIMQSCTKPWLWQFCGPGIWTEYRICGWPNAQKTQMHY